MISVSLPPGLLIAPLSAIADPGVLVVEVGHDGKRVSLLLTRRGALVAAFLNRCPHAGYPLQRADGRVLVQQGRYMVCGAHGASFELETGACAGGPCNGEGLTRVAVAMRGDEVVTA